MNFILDARTVTPHFPGIGRYVGSLVTEIPRLLTPEENLVVLRQPGSAFSADIAKNEKVTWLESDSSPFGLNQQRKVPPLLKSRGVYHSPYYLMPYRPGIPTVLTIYDLIPIRFPKLVSLRARLMFRLTTRLALKTADHIICISSATRSDLLREFPRLDPNTISAIPLAPAPQFTPQPQAEQDRVRKAHQLPENFALYIGINKPHKNLVQLVNAWAKSSIEIPLVIGGAWDDRYPEAKAIAVAHGLIDSGRVCFIGRIPDADLPALYSACRLFVFPSKYEGFGLPVIEAMACGAAVVCSNTSSLPEVGGDAAYYFDPHDIESIISTIQNALRFDNDPQQVITQAQKFTWGKTAEATVAIYRSIAYNSQHNQ